jgi:ABC-type antimicrobial peptide transport system permease subunit
MALGAEPGTIFGMVLRETLVLVLSGLALGFPIAWAATIALKSQLFGLSAHDAGTMLLASLAIVAVTAIAGFIPARRASHVDPTVALRYE